MSTLTNLTVDPSLEALATSINSEHDEVMGTVRRGLQHARRAGLSLMLAKEKVAHGQWGEWVNQNLTFSERTVQGYMQIARKWDELQGIILQKAQDPADIGLEKALRFIAGPKPLKKQSHSNLSGTNDVACLSTGTTGTLDAGSSVLDTAFEDTQLGVKANGVSELFHDTLSRLIFALSELSLIGHHLRVRHLLTEQIAELAQKGHAVLVRLQESFRRNEADSSPASVIAERSN